MDQSRDGMKEGEQRKPRPSLADVVLSGLLMQAKLIEAIFKLIRKFIKGTALV